MLRTLRESFDAGIEKIKWFAEFLSERLKVELAVFKLMGEQEKLKKKWDNLARLIGGKVFEGRNQAQWQQNVYKDEEVKNCLMEMELIEEEMNTLRARLSGAGRPDGAGHPGGTGSPGGKQP